MIRDGRSMLNKRWNYVENISCYKKVGKVCLTQLKTFSLGIFTMSCSHEPNVLEVGRRNKEETVMSI